MSTSDEGSVSCKTTPPIFTIAPWGEGNYTKAYTRVPTHSLASWASSKEYFLHTRDQELIEHGLEMVQQARALAALPEDLDSVPSTHTVAHNHL
jgi:hypothetical protein